MKNTHFEIEELLELYENNKDEEYELYKKHLNELGMKVKKDDFTYSFLKCKDYLKTHIKKIRNTTDYFIDNQIVSHSQLLNVFKCFPKDVKKWFETEYPTFYFPVIKTKQDEVQPNEINLFKGFLHTHKPFHEFSEASKSAVKYFFEDYIKDSLCSNNAELYGYVKLWLANMIQGNKNISALVLKGTQGIGKSTIVDFLRDYVLGTNIYINSNNRPLATDFNYPLMGKLLVSFEELQGSNQFETKKVESQFKDFITNSITNYKKEHSTPLENVNNINNYITTSNDFGALKGDDGRRFCILDISTKHINNNDGFFTVLRSKCFNPTVGHAFYSYCCEVDVCNFNSSHIPLTKRKIEAHLNSLTPVIEFVRKVYLFQQKPLTVKCYALYKEYDSHCCCNNITRIKKKLFFYQQLEHYGLVKTKINGQIVYNYDYPKLQEIAKHFKWNMEDGDISENEDTEMDEYDEIEDILKRKQQIITNLEFENTVLKENIKKLENSINELKPRTINNDEYTASIVKQLLTF